MAEFDIVDLSERPSQRALRILRKELQRRRAQAPLQPGVRLEFKPQDMWVGVYWKKNGSLVDIWVCLVPMVPIHIRFFVKQRFPERAQDLEDDDDHYWMSPLGVDEFGGYGEE